MPVYLLSDEMVFPSPEEAEENGLLAVGGDLSLKDSSWLIILVSFPGTQKNHLSFGGLLILV
jgi:hypothetical protein